MPKPNIEKIVFNVRGKKLELTSEEAKELKQILSDLFGETKVVHEVHEYWKYWQRPYSPWPYATWSCQAQTLTGSVDAINYSNNLDTLSLTVN